MTPDTPQQLAIRIINCLIRAEVSLESETYYAIDIVTRALERQENLVENQKTQDVYQAAVTTYDLFGGEG